MKRRLVGRASAEASHAVWEAHRTYVDAQAVRQIANDRYRRADEVASRLEETTRRNHFGEAVSETMRRPPR